MSCGSAGDQLTALILTYHAVEAGPPPLCTDEKLFRAHLDVIEDAGAKTMTVTELAHAVRTRTLPKRAVAITFDDAISSAVHTAAPMLTERGMTATIFCVAAHLGGASDWPSQPHGRRNFQLASASELTTAAALGMEIGSHGYSHAPLLGDDPGFLRRELVDSRVFLEDQIGADVRSFAFPYGVRSPAAEGLQAESGYEAACTGGFGVVEPGVDPLALPRVDAHYLRRPGLLRHAIAGSPRVYLGVRRMGARARRLVVADYGSGS